MGICTSCYSSNSNPNAVTVKLILLDGQLKEFSSHVPLTDLTDDFSSFICNSDEMDFDKYVTAMSGEEVLRPGQLYFELPVSWLKRRLTPEDMASLAVKAGEALRVSGGKVRCGCWVKRVDPFVFCYDDDEMMSSSGSRVGGGDDDVGNHGRAGRRHRGDGGKGRMFTMLESIVEE